MELACIAAHEIKSCIPLAPDSSAWFKVRPKCRPNSHTSEAPMRCTDGAHGPLSRFRLTYMKGPINCRRQGPFFCRCLALYIAPSCACGKATNSLSSVTRGPPYFPTRPHRYSAPPQHACKLRSFTLPLPSGPFSQPASADSPRKATTACKPQCTCMSRLPGQRRPLGKGSSEA